MTLPSSMNSVATIETEQNVASDLMLRPIHDIIVDLSQPVNPRRLKTRKQGGKQITYLPWYQAIRYLDHYAPGWSYEVRSVNTVGDAVAITARISIPCAEGIVWREATGYEPITVKGYGDPTSNAESMALRRAAAKFGLCLYLYGM
jgi:hypothetical protein